MFCEENQLDQRHGAVRHRVFISYAQKRAELGGVGYFTEFSNAPPAFIRIEPGSRSPAYLEFCERKGLDPSIGYVPYQAPRRPSTGKPRGRPKKAATATNDVDMIDGIGVTARTSQGYFEPPVIQETKDSDDEIPVEFWDDIVDLD